MLATDSCLSPLAVSSEEMQKDIQSSTERCQSLEAAMAAAQKKVRHSESRSSTPPLPSNLKLSFIIPLISLPAAAAHLNSFFAAGEGE